MDDRLCIQQLEKAQPSQYEGPWSSYQSPYTVNQNFQAYYNYNGDAGYPAPDFYLSSGHMGSGLQEQSCYNYSFSPPQMVFFGEPILPNTYFHNAGNPASF